MKDFQKGKGRKQANKEQQDKYENFVKACNNSTNKASKNKERVRALN